MTRTDERGRVRRGALLIGTPIVAALALGGCRAKPKNFDNDNDALRRQVAELETELTRVRAERNELEAQMREFARARASGSDDLGADVIAALPRCAGIRIGRFSGFVDRDELPGPEAVNVYVIPFDGRQRFVQVVGRLTVEASLLPPLDRPADVAARAESLARVDLGPADLREAYRSSPMGTHYTVSLPLEPGRTYEGSIVLNVRLVDLVSGLSHDVQYIPAATD